MPGKLIYASGDSSLLFYSNVSKLREEVHAFCDQMLTSLEIERATGVKAQLHEAFNGFSPVLTEIVLVYLYELEKVCSDLMLTR